MVTVNYLGKEYNLQDYESIINFLYPTGSSNNKYAFENEISKILHFNASISNTRYSYAVCDLSTPEDVIYYENSDTLSVDFPNVIVSFVDKQNMQSSVSYSSELMSLLKNVYNV